MKLSLPTINIAGLAKAPVLIFLLFLKYRLYVLLLGIFIILSGACNQKPKSVPGLERISVDLSEARTGKLSEFFEPHIEYIWLEDDSQEAQLNAGLQKNTLLRKPDLHPGYLRVQMYPHFRQIR
ncbi:MAG: hypothetical protein R6V72_18485 [Cyclobacterium sp.]|uniref:hypothetical protein n=1 Tax=Cyclobacterium sp. TaxID=1966343 RepID=UPI003970F76A